MLLLAMTCLRADEQDADVARAILRGDMHDGLRMGLGRLDRADGSAVGRQAALGQVMAQVLLSIGRIEQAEELLQGQLRLYASLSRPQMRWMASLDRGYFSLSLNKPGRAAESFNVVADGNEVPLKLRLEALLGLSSALHRLGEFHRASRTLAHAVVLAQPADALRLRLLEATRLEHEALEVLRDYDVSCEATRDRGGRAHLLRMASEALPQMPLACHRLRFLAHLVDPELRTSRGAAQVLDGVRWWRERRIHHSEEISRIEAALAFLRHDNADAASEVLGPLATDVARQNQHRHMSELKYCASRLYAIQGRHVEALRSLRQHASQALLQLRSELKQVPYSRFLEQQRAEKTSLDELSLPPRYRKAYRFILDHIKEPHLTIRRVAAHIEVSERALQTAFRSHLGMTPAGVIRQLRMTGIRAEIQQQSVRESVLVVAKRWGTGSRSSLTKNFREQFNETPAATPDRDREDASKQSTESHDAHASGHREVRASCLPAQKAGVEAECHCACAPSNGGTAFPERSRLPVLLDSGNGAAVDDVLCTRDRRRAR